MPDRNSEPFITAHDLRAALAPPGAPRRPGALLSQPSGAWNWGPGLSDAQRRARRAARHRRRPARAARRAPARPRHRNHPRASAPRRAQLARLHPHLETPRSRQGTARPRACSTPRPPARQPSRRHPSLAPRRDPTTHPAEPRPPTHRPSSRRSAPQSPPTAVRYVSRRKIRFIVLVGLEGTYAVVLTATALQRLADATRPTNPNTQPSPERR